MPKTKLDEQPCYYGAPNENNVLSAIAYLEGEDPRNLVYSLANCCRNDNAYRCYEKHE